MKIVMVCLGNICRSPLADGLLRKKVAEAGLDIEVDSAGTAAYHIGDPPDVRMRATAKSKDCPIDDLRARQFVVEDYDRFDRIYVMDESNKNNVLSLARTAEDEAKVEMILNLSHPSMDLEVPDPYFGGEEGFLEVYQLLDEATDILMNDLKN
ncbi:MAG: low molecular weight phosphotyrosine protein phosphatase [Crocinitomicaceae bacterium]|nr:low molecular weight phosphotyrosine protein phosphatase [Crocinitomicaceae bacterium]